MRVSDAEVRQQIVASVKSFYSCVAPKQLLDGTDPLFKTKPRTFSSDNRFSRLSLSEALSLMASVVACLCFGFFSFSCFILSFFLFLIIHSKIILCFCVTIFVWNKQDITFQFSNCC